MLLRAKLPVPHMSAVALQEAPEQLLHCNMMILKWRRKVELRTDLLTREGGQVLEAAAGDELR